MKYAIWYITGPLDEEKFLSKDMGGAECCTLILKAFACEVKISS